MKRQFHDFMSYIQEVIPEVILSENIVRFSAVTELWVGKVKMI
jgi:hypothetical protein